MIIYKIKIFINIKLSNYYWIFRTLYDFPKNKVILISFFADYDESERYRKAAFRLSKKLKAWGIPHSFEQIKDQGGYQKNTLFKPTFISKKISELKKNVIWIDCDTVPNNPKAIYQIAKLGKPFVAISAKGDRQNMQVGLLKFEIDDFSLNLLNKWKQYCEFTSLKNINELDHEALRDVIIPNMEDDSQIGYVILKLKEVGFKSSTHSEDALSVVNIQRSLIKDIQRNSIFKHVINENLQ